MKYLKIMALLALAATVLMGLAASASATRVTSPVGTLYTGKLTGTGVGHSVIHSSSISTIECSSTVVLEVQSHGTGVTATGPVTSLTFSWCTGNNTVTGVPKMGTFEMHWTSGSNGELTLSGQEISVFNHSFNGTCIYTTTNTDIGPITAGSPAKLRTKAGGAVINRTGGTLGLFCGSTATWTYEYEITTPTTVLLDH